MSNSIGNSKLLEDAEDDEADDEEEDACTTTNGIERTSTTWTTSLLELELESAGGTGVHELEELLELEEPELSKELMEELDSSLEESSRR